MYTITAVSVITVFILGAEARVAKRNGPTNGCEELTNCYDPVTRIFETGNIVGIPYLTAAEYTQVCQLNNETQSCFAARTDNCVCFSMEFLSTSFLRLAYFCSDEGRARHQRIVNSQCVTNRTAGFVASNSLKTCLDTYNELVFNNADLCSSLQESSDCLLRLLNNQCGYELATFARKLWTFSYNSIALKFNCDLEE